MKYKNLFNIFLCVVILFVSIPFYANAEEITAEYVPGEIIITTEADLIDSSTTFLTSSVDDYIQIDFADNEIDNAEKVNTYNEITEEKTYVLEVDGDILDKCKELEELPGVISAEPNLVFHTMDFTMPGEVSYPTSTYSTYQKWYFDLMNIPDTWQEYEATGEGVLIAVIDNGYNVGGYEFPTNLWTDSNGNHGWNTYLNSADISPIYKSDGTAFSNSSHGSNVAGIIGMLANSSSAIGAAYDAQLMLINAAHYIDDDTIPNFELADLIEAIDYARVNGADIINLSLGAFGTAPSLEAAVNRAYNAGIAVIAAVGNSGISTETAKNIPASYENVIGVMAIDKTDPTQLAYFSNYDPSGEYYDVSAPGYAIAGCHIEAGKLVGLSGTSQATPLVASCAALYLSAYPDATVDELYDAIRNSPTTKVTSNTETVTDATYYFKSLNALELLGYGKIEPEIVFNLNTTVTNDPYLKYIYGLEEGYSDITNYVTVTDGTGTAEFIPTENGNGTGSLYNVYDIYGDLYITYRIIIFGDTNGDSYADGQDAVITSFITVSPDSFEDYLKFSADVDFDDSVTESDYDITAKYAIGLDYVFQTR